MHRALTSIAWVLVAIVLVHAQCLGVCGAGMLSHAPEAACHEEESSDTPSPDKHESTVLCSDEQAFELRLQGSFLVEPAELASLSAEIAFVHDMRPAVFEHFSLNLSPPVSLQTPLRI
jgi:hypothetical protein